MILADKIIQLRKKSGWSQEELAAQMGVSRQSVSKWESGQSIPDLDKILKLSALFNVSTDFLLKDELSDAPVAVDQAPEADAAVRTVSMEEADAFLTLQAQAAPKIALGVSLCILSPMLLIYLGALSDVEGGYRVSEAVAMAVGLPVLLLVVVGAVALFLRYGRPLERYDYLDKEAIELAYGVEGVVRKRHGAMVKRHTTRLIVGTALCILAAVPLFVSAVFEEQGALMGPVYGLLATLAMVAVGVYLLVETCTLNGSYQRLLEEGDYTRAKKEESKRNGPLLMIFWGVTTGIYLFWSFWTDDWERTWLVWPVAGVLFVAALGMSSMLHERKK
ncbi:MAG: helix-turn-helix transcriptional regulator [Peptococcaceae bacterium]|nr:helix-turn-helix transcriptional regulator [Peptococcaceae bacterium]